MPKTKLPVDIKLLMKMYRDQQEIRDGEPDMEQKTLTTLSKFERLPSDVEFNMPIVV